jgi:cytochrome b subunit of formate dehydrogenase
MRQSRIYTAAVVVLMACATPVAHASEVGTPHVDDASVSASSLPGTVVTHRLQRYGARGGRYRVAEVGRPLTNEGPGARDIEECFDCHDDESFTMERDGREISLHVDPSAYEDSPHGGLDCLDCHVGFDPYEEPHLEVIEPVNCGSCHDDATAAHARSGHVNDLTCTTCHDNVHTVTGTDSGESDCRSCHEGAGADVDASAHAGNDVAPGCVGCHSEHRFDIPESDKCLSCHGEREFVHEHITHEDVDAVLAYEESIHGGLIDCSDCHAGHLVLSPEDPQSAVSRRNMAATCSECHREVADQYRSSEHGIALETDFELAPVCSDCHGEHDIHQIADAESPVSRSHEVEVCLACHLDAPNVTSRMTHTTGFIAAYESSVHGRAAAEGNQEAAICSDCHGAHEAMKVSNPNARVNQFNISATCGACHAEIQEAYELSIHGEALAEGIGDAPTCTSCHSEHEILAPEDSDSPVAGINVSQQVCAPCHESFKLSEKYGFPSDRTASFSDSYHGLAGRFGSAASANCASCHGIHDIWPSTDPRSRVHADNLQVTCGECHPGANANFALGSVHIVRSPQGDRLLYWIATVYMALIIGTIGAMGLHNVLDWIRKTIARYQRRTEPVAPVLLGERRPGLYVRMSLSERLQHVLLASSFILLVITGFMLKYPEAWWVATLRDIVGKGLFDMRGLVHRIAAVIMVGDSLYHLYYISFTERGRTILRDIWFRKKDFVDMKQMLLYNLGLRSERPQFDRFNYIEKSEYWALMWGTIVMTVTGIVLWFENQFMGRFSKLFVDVNETIHYYEAWLAFLAIVVWHIYYVVFNPDVYPMNFSWITGKLTEEEMEHEHPLELERLKRQAEDEAESREL